MNFDCFGCTNKWMTVSIMQWGTSIDNNNKKLMWLVIRNVV